MTEPSTNTGGSEVSDNAFSGSTAAQSGNNNTQINHYAAPPAAPPERDAPQRERHPGVGSRRRRLLPLVLSFALFFVGGSIAGLLWNGSTDGARDETVDAVPTARSSSGENDSVADLPTHIDAVLPTPDGADPDYWLFSGDHYIRVRISAEKNAANPVQDYLTHLTALDSWTGTLRKFPEFRGGIDTALRVPGHQNEYWVFSKDKYIRIRIADTPPYYEDTLVHGPRSISEDWKKVFKGLRLHDIDALMPVPDDPKQVWVFAGNQYIRAEIYEENFTGKPGGIAKTRPRSIDEAWRNTFGETPGFKGGIDEAIPVPGDRNTYWVFSGKQYMKIHVTSTEYADTVVQGPRNLSF